MEKFLFTMLALITSVTTYCPSNCRCTKYTTQCSLAKLYGIPQNLPSTTQKLVMKNDNITELSAELLLSTDPRTMRTLEFHYTNTWTVQNSTFRAMTQLSTLVITHNRIEYFPYNTFWGLRLLYRLILSHNHIQTLNPRMFMGLGHLSTLDLSNNYIKQLPNEWLSGMKDPSICHLKMTKRQTINLLDLSRNRIQNITAGTFRGGCAFTHLILLGNDLGVLQEDIFTGLSSLKTLDLRSSKFRLQGSGAFNGLSSLTRLTTEGSTIKTVSGGLLQDMTNVEHLNLSYSQIRSLEVSERENTKDAAQTAVTITGPFYMQTNLRGLFMDGNAIKHLRTNVFVGLSDLTSLYCSNNKLSILFPGAFKGLPQLKILLLSGNEIRIIFPGAFEYLYELKKLDLSYNQINAIAEDTFVGLQNLRELKLTATNLHTIHDDAFRGLGFLKSLSLDYNWITGIGNGIFHHLIKLDQFDISRNPGLSLDTDNCKGLQVVQKFTASIVRKDYLNSSGGSLMRDLLRDEFVERLNFDQIDLTFKGQFTDLQFSTLEIRFGDIEIIRRLTLIGLSKLKSLVLYSSKIHTIEIGSFNNLQELTSLDLGYNNIEELKRGVFQGLIRLKRLSLIKNRISEITEGVFSAFCRNEATTRHIHNTSVCYTAIGRNIVENNSTCSKFYALVELKYLMLDSNIIQTIHSRAFIHNQKLQVLSLLDNRLLGHEFSFIHVPSLRELRLSHCNIMKIASDAFQCVPNLEDIDLSVNDITSIDVKAFKELKNLRFVKLKVNRLQCDCEMLHTWEWFNRRGIKTDSPNCSGHQNLMWDVVFSDMECNYSHILYEISDIPKISVDKLEIFKVYVEPVILALIFLIGIVGNSFIIFIFAAHPDMRTGPNVCILNLALGDCLSLVVNLPLSYWDIVHVSWDLGTATCKLFLGARDVSVGVTVFSVVAMSIQRHRVVARSFRRDQGLCGLSQHKTMLMYTLLVWGIASGLALPTLYTATVDVRCLYASFEDEYIRRTWTIQLVLYCVLPVCVITLLNVRTASLLKRSAREMPGETQLSAAQGREKVANMVVVLTLVFSVSYVPNFLLRVLFAWAVLEHDSDFTFFVSFASFCLFFLNSCFNPIALLSISTPIRDLFFKYIRWHRLKTKGTQAVPGEQIPFQTISEIRARRLAAAAACRRASRTGETVQAAEISIHV